MHTVLFFLLLLFFLFLFSSPSWTGGFAALTPNQTAKPLVYIQPTHPHLVVKQVASKQIQSPVKTKASLQSSFFQQTNIPSLFHAGKETQVLPGEDCTVLSDAFPRSGFVVSGCSCRHIASRIHLTRPSGGRNFTVFGCGFAHGIMACLGVLRPSISALSPTRGSLFS